MIIWVSEKSERGVGVERDCMNVRSFAFIWLQVWWTDGENHTEHSLSLPLLLTDNMQNLILLCLCLLPEKLWLASGQRVEGRYRSEITLRLSLGNLGYGSNRGISGWNEVDHLQWNTKHKSLLVIYSAYGTITCTGCRLQRKYIMYTLRNHPVFEHYFSLNLN